MEKEGYYTALLQKKLDYIEKIVSEKSLDTLSAWMDMYDEARFVASMYSDEEELKAEHAEAKKKFLQMADKCKNTQTI